MKVHFFSLIVLFTIFTFGCDAWFSRRIDVGSTESGLTLSKTDSAAVLESIREYAREEKIPCNDSGQLPIECWHQPIRIWAVSNGPTIVVCYRAMGIPLESGKFERYMDRLEKLIRRRVGNAAIRTRVGSTPVQDQCPNPPMFLNNNDPRLK